MKLIGKGTFNLYGADGELKQTVEKDNMIVSAGFDFICASLATQGARPAVMGWIEIGTGVTAVASGQTALVTPLIRQAITAGTGYAHTVGTTAFTVSTTFAPGVGIGAITEAGVFNASSGGTMLDRVVFAVINKGADDTLTAQFQFTLS